VLCTVATGYKPKGDNERWLNYDLGNRVVSISQENNATP
jgi:hypothetical protein